MINIDLDSCLIALKSEGFYIQKSAISKEVVSEIRDFWVNYFKTSVDPQNDVVWNPYLGMKNCVTYSDNHFNKLFRSYDFKWNSPVHEGTRKILDELEDVRQRIVEGLTGSPGEYSTYYSASFYPINGGFMKGHSDGVEDGKVLYHSLIPLTIKGHDYVEGGQYLVNNFGEKILTDDLMELGDLVIYNGIKVHGVDPIASKLENHIGRIQIFSIPTVFSYPENSDEFLMEISIKKFVKSKIKKFKNTVMPIFGKEKFLRR